MTVLDCMILMGFLSLIIVSVQESFIGNLEIYFYYYCLLLSQKWVSLGFIYCPWINFGFS